MCKERTKISTFYFIVIIMKVFFLPFFPFSLFHKQVFSFLHQMLSFTPKQRVFNPLTWIWMLWIPYPIVAKKVWLSLSWDKIVFIDQFNTTARRVNNHFSRPGVMMCTCLHTASVDRWVVATLRQLMLVLARRIYACHLKTVLLGQLLHRTFSQRRIQRFYKGHMDIVPLLGANRHGRTFKRSWICILVVCSSSDVGERWLDAILIEIVIRSFQIAAISKIWSHLSWSLILILQKKIIYKIWLEVIFGMAVKPLLYRWFSKTMTSNRKLGSIIAHFPFSFYQWMTFSQD